MYNYKAHYFLDCDNGIEKAIVQHPPTPEEILEDKQLRDQLYAAVMELPDKQAKWIYARFYLGMTVKEIAQAEDVDLSWVYKSIKRGLKCLGKISKTLINMAKMSPFSSLPLEEQLITFIGTLTTE